jgi:hypothetical protein
MAAWRTVGAGLVLFALAQAGWAQTYHLAETVQADDCFRTRLELTLTGEIRVARGDGKRAGLPLTAKATHEFAERVLAAGADGLVGKSARVYETAAAVITVDGGRSEKALRKERRLCVAQRAGDEAFTYSPAGPLTREELELVGEHFDTLCLAGLLPGKDVAVGDTWQVPNPVAQSLCHFEGLTEQDLACKLEEADGKVARVAVTGSATGIELGALVKLKVEARYRFDLGAHRLTWLEWKQTDDREQGPASPALTAQSTTTLTRTAVARPETLTDAALVSVPGAKVPEPLRNVEYRDAKDRFSLVYDRAWQVVGQPEGRLILRLMDRGDFVAQATVTPWRPAPKGKHLSEDEFRAAMADTPGWEAEKELQAGEVPAADGSWVYRLSTLGQLDGVAVMQNFYLVAGPGGEQVVVAVTLTPKKADALGSRDLSLAGSIEFPPAGKEEKK